MKLLLDFLPIALFFAAFKIWDIYVATGVAMVAQIALIAWLRFSKGKIEPMQWMSLGIILVFGGATIIFHDEAFIKVKPTVLYWLMGGALFVGWVGFKRNFVKSLLGAQLQLPDEAWLVLNRMWVVFFAVLGVVNLWVAHAFSTETWVTFKLFGVMGLFVVFAIVQGLYMSRHMQETPGTGEP